MFCRIFRILLLWIFILYLVSVLRIVNIMFCFCRDDVFLILSVLVNLSSLVGFFFFRFWSVMCFRLVRDLGRVVFLVMMDFYRES